MDKVEKAKIRKQMKELKKQGKDFHFLASTPELYQVYLQVLYSK